MFHVILLVVFAIITGLVCWAAGGICRKPRLVRRWLVLANGGAFLALNMFWAADGGEWWPMLAALAIFLMAEVLLVYLVAPARFIRWLYRKIRQPSLPVDAEKRRLLKGAAVYPAAALAAASYGGMVERNDTVIRRYDVPVAGGAEGLAGFKIIQLSDIHIGPFLDLDDLAALLEKAAALGGDILALTGDVFDDDRINEKAAKVIDSYVDKFPQGIWYCFGNHEYFRAIKRTEYALKETRINVLRNEARPIPGTPGKRRLYMVGVDYPKWRDQFDAQIADFTETAWHGVPPDAVTVLLAHHPLFIDRGAERGAALVLTGHTHGGQLGVFGVPLVPHRFKYMRGVYQVGETFGYVHCGNGSWFPFRLGCPPEIAVFTLK